MITIELEDKEAEFLEEILWRYQDEGPFGEGWASKELQNLRDKISKILKND